MPQGQNNGTGEAGKLHPLFRSICEAHGAPKADTYRGWAIEYDPPPIPNRNFDWCATGPDYDASLDGEWWIDNGDFLTARTREDLIAAIDAHLSGEAQ